jgi:rsbT co-antagonist protein RsbR
MSENSNDEIKARLLNQLPGYPWAVRLDPVTMHTTWLYIKPQMGELYGMSDAEFHADPEALVKHLVPEDRAQFERDFAASFQTLTPFFWTGRVSHRTGTIRWIETYAAYERDADGAILALGQTFDVTDRKRVEHMQSAVIEAVPIGIMVLDLAGKFLVYNAAADTYAGPVQREHVDDLTQVYGVFKTDGVTSCPNEEIPLLLGLEGKEVETELLLRNPFVEGDRWVHTTGLPIRDENGKVFAGMAAFHDVTVERRLERELRARNEELAASEEAKTQLIERLRYSIDELSNPILEIWDDVLVMPIIGVVDSRRTADMVQRLLGEVARTQASFVIIDLTGVEIVDTKTADHLMKLMRKVEVVGARCVLTGIRAAVAETLVDIGVDFGRITTLRNLKHGLREALRHGKRQREGGRDVSLDDEPNEVSQTPSGGRPRQR